MSGPTTKRTNCSSTGRSPDKSSTLHCHCGLACCGSSCCLPLWPCMFSNISAAYVALHASTKVIRMIPQACNLRSLHGSTFGCPSFPASLPAHPVPMTAAWKLEDFQAEMAHLEELHKIRPDSQILQNMANTVCKRIQAIDVWTAHGVLGLTSKAEALQVPAAIKAQLTEAIEASCAQQGTSHLKLTNAGQVVQDITPYLTQDDWTKLEFHVPTRLHGHIGQAAGSHGLDWSQGADQPSGNWPLEVSGPLGQWARFESQPG